jgi:dissimilatory sulfite reductase related protein
MKIGDEEYPLDGNGFLQQPERWNRQVAEAIAREESIPEMTEQHWAVVNFIRSHWQANELAPPVRLLCQSTNVGVRDMYKLFRSGPAKGACRIAGLPKPDGCV